MPELQCCVASIDVCRDVSDVEMHIFRQRVYLNKNAANPCQVVQRKHGKGVFQDTKFIFTTFCQLK